MSDNDHDCFDWNSGGACFLCRRPLSVEEQTRDDPPPYERPELRLCCCGCSEAEHDGAGRCRFCGSEDCGGFTYDEEATCTMLAIGEGFEP